MTEFTGKAKMSSKDKGELLFKGSLFLDDDKASITATPNDKEQLFFKGDKFSQNISHESRSGLTRLSPRSPKFMVLMQLGVG